MSLTIPTFDELVDTFVANYEAALGQDAPITPKAFLRILGYTQALVVTGLYKLTAERSLQSLALTATEEDLETIGEEYGVTRQPAVAAELIILCSGEVSTLIPAGTIFIGDANGLEYYTKADVTTDGITGLASPTVVCFTTGVDSQLATNETMTLSTPLTDINNAATVTSTAVEGVDQEDIEVYRREVLDEIQTVGGGSNLADFRTWAVETPDVVRAFPYSGTPNRMSVSFVDWDMEKAGVADWSTDFSPTLTKETGTPHAGLQVLRIQRGATASPTAYQSVFTKYNEYAINGWARSDGNCTPSLKCGAATLWTGTTSTSWQEIDITVLIGSSASHDLTLRLVCGGGASGQHVEFDDFTILQTDYPGHVTVYIEADTDIDADGIPTSTELTAARNYINTDQTTGIDRPSLGLVDDNLFVEPIIRTAIYLEIRGLDIASELETQAKADLDTEVDAYLRNATPYIQGLDSQTSQADQITDPLISKVVQDVLDSYGATATGIGIGTEVGVFISSYSLGAGETAKLGSITYV
jgi:uncharacterized phage protein gp47/JayE